MSTFILIHGSSIGGWCWSKVKCILENHGHSVYAPDLPGHSKEKRVAPREITLERYVTFICELVNSLDEKPVLVGHSMGGALITNAAEHVFDRIKSLVYVCALIPQHGQSIVEILQSDTDNGTTKTKDAVVIDQNEMCINCNPDKIGETLFNGCSMDDITYAKNHLVSQPLIPFTEPIMIENQNFKKLDRVGIVCTEDRSVSPVFQECMYKKAGCAVEYLKSGHAPYFSRTEELSKILMSHC